jgi:hypothetical protein
MALWFQVIVGLWVLLSPWLLGVSGISILMWSNLAAGLALIITGVWRIFESAAPQSSEK